MPQAVCDAAKADKARLEWLEVEVDKQTNRANALELQRAGLQDRVKQLEVQWGINFLHLAGPRPHLMTALAVHTRHLELVHTCICTCSFLCIFARNTILRFCISVSSTTRKQQHKYLSRHTRVDD